MNKHVILKRNDNLRLAQREALEYFQAIVGELRNMAAGNRLPMIAYLLEMTYIEVCDALRNGEQTRTAKIDRDQLEAIKLMYAKRDGR